MTPAVRKVFTRKYAKAESATAAQVAAMSPRAGASRRKTSPATKADVAKEPELKAIFTTGLRVGVTAFTAACTKAQSTPSPVPYSPSLARTAAKDTELAEQRNMN